MHAAAWALRSATAALLLAQLLLRAAHTCHREARRHPLSDPPHTPPFPSAAAAAATAADLAGAAAAVARVGVSDPLLRGRGRLHSFVARAVEEGIAATSAVSGDGGWEDSPGVVLSSQGGAGGTTPPALVHAAPGVDPTLLLLRALLPLTLAMDAAPVPATAAVAACDALLLRLTLAASCVRIEAGGYGGGEGGVGDAALAYREGADAAVAYGARRSAPLTALAAHEELLAAVADAAAAVAAASVGITAHA